jgi:CRISPR/Cas system CMR subunit Cmr4 (Cas7 group RAMP superfamily)
MNTPTPDHYPRQYVHLLRITLQLKSPLALGSGYATSEFDGPCALDANGLPFLPGTSLAGSLRAWISGLTLNGKPASADDWLGFVKMQAKEDERGDEGLTSPLRLTAGHIHNAKNQVQDGQVLPVDWQTDPILGPLASALPHREHVRLNHRGVGADTGKFDRSFVPRGHRFTFQIQISPYPDETAAWAELSRQLLAALAGGELSLGSAQRAGFGRVQAEQAWCTRLNLCDGEQRKQLLDWRRLDLEPPASCKISLPTPKLDVEAAANVPSSGRDIHLSLSLTACDYWRVGSAANGLRASGLTTDTPDDQPYREQFVNWNSVPAQFSHGWVVPGSALKGALAHRTTFHLNRLDGRWAGQGGELAPLEAVHALFGIEAHTDSDIHKRTTGRSTATDAPLVRGAGAVWMDDAIPGGNPMPELVRFNHVRLDRFTGGAYGGALFNEDALFGGSIQVRLRLRPASLHYLCPDADRQKRIVKAFNLALNDLADSQLAVGANAASGLGYFKSSDANQTSERLKKFANAVLAALLMQRTTKNGQTTIPAAIA